MDWEDGFWRHLALLCYGMIYIIPYDSDFIRAPHVTFGAERFGIRQEKLFQRLWISPSKHTTGIGNLDTVLTFPEVLPKMGQMIERVRIDSLLYCISPLFVSDWHISNLPPDCPPQSFNDFPHCRSLAHQGVYILGGQAGASEKNCGYSGYVFCTSEWNDGLAITPRQE